MLLLTILSNTELDGNEGAGKKVVSKFYIRLGLSQRHNYVTQETESEDLEAAFKRTFYFHWESREVWDV